MLQNITHERRAPLLIILFRLLQAAFLLFVSHLQTTLSIRHKHSVMYVSLGDNTFLSLGSITTSKRCATLANSTIKKRLKQKENCTLFYLWVFDVRPQFGPEMCFQYLLTLSIKARAYFFTFSMVRYRCHTHLCFHVQWSLLVTS